MDKCVFPKTFAEALKLSLPSRLLVLPQEESENTDSEAADPKPWHCLPYNVLVKICRYLHDRDRGQMAFVCRQWYEATKNPSLWRSHVFYLYSNCEAPRGLSWLSSRVNYLQHATIMCFGCFDRHRAKFLRAMQHANLYDLDINGTAYWWAAGKGHATLGRVTASIVRLLRTQRRLRGFQMRQAMLDFGTGMSVLDAVSLSSGETITRLGLEDFFGDDSVIRSPFVPEKFTSCLTKFPYLSDLTINYEYLTDSMLYWLAQCGKNRTIHLSLVSWLTVFPIPFVSRQAWAALAKSGPDIRVYLILQNIRIISEVCHDILLPEVPMHRLDLVGIAALGGDDVQEMVSMLQHIGECYGKRLHGLRLWDPLHYRYLTRSDNDVSEEIEVAILNLLKQMPRLVYLDLHMDVHAHFLSKICELQTKKVLKLQTLRMARSLTDFLEFDCFRSEIKAWFPVLKELKLDFHIRAESAPNPRAWNEYVFIIADSGGIVDSEEDSRLSENGWQSSSVTPTANTNNGSSNDSNSNSNNNSSSSNNSDNSKGTSLKALSMAVVSLRKFVKRLKDSLFATKANSHFTPEFS